MRIPTELQRAVRPRVVCRYFGQLGLLVAALQVPPLVVALLDGDPPGFALRLALLAAATAAVAAVLARVRAPRQIQHNEAVAVVAAAFLAAPLTMTWPLMAGGLPAVDACFEAISGVTTTGLSTRPPAAAVSAAELFARAWMQWYGGLGIVVLSLAVLFPPGSLARSIAAVEVADDPLSGTRATARRLLAVYGAGTGVAFAVLLACGMGGFDALAHSLAAVSTGGFATRPTSLAELAPAAQVAVIVVGLAGALPLALWTLARRHDGNRSLHLLQAAALAACGAAVAVLVLAVGGDVTMRDAVLLTCSAQSTSGFATVEPGQLDPGGRAALLVAMTVGGGVGSTAGGVKVLRVLIVLRLLHMVVVRSSCARHAVVEASLGGRRIEDDEITRALLLIACLVVAVVVSWLPFVASGYDALDSLFEVVSAIGTVGLSSGVCSHDLPTSLKAVLAADMLLGRLEVLLWIVVLAPRTWLGRRDPSWRTESMP